MRKTVLSVSVLLFIFMLTAAEMGGAAEKLRHVRDLRHDSGKMGTYRALIIGINKYKDKYIPSLRAARKDAVAMEKLLRTRYGFETKLLLDQNATRAAIYNALRKLAVEAGEKDSVLIYYAGHGERDDLLKGGWWVPSDAKEGEPVSYLDNTIVQRVIAGMRARHVLLVSDSCYAGTLFGQGRNLPPMLNERYYLKLYNEISRWGMTSGNKGPVEDRGAEGHSLFAYLLLRELRENEKPFIATQEVFARIAPIVGNNSEQNPVCKPIRNTGDLGGQFVFVASSASGVTAPTPAPEETTLAVSCNVRGAQVFLDERHVGNTDLSDFNVVPGEHRLRVEKEGYESYQRSVSVGKGSAESVRVILKQYVVPAPAPKKALTNSLGMKFVYIPPGEFMMGSPESEPERYNNEKQHKVTLTKGFHMQTTEVTQGQWEAVMGSNPSGFKNCGNDCPVESVSWDDVQDFIRKLNRKEGTDRYRLPTEAEWEYAARAGTSTAYNWGKLADCSKANYGNGYGSECEGTNPGKTMRVASFAPNAWGLYDMHGNVWEWCQDWYGDYPSGAVTDPGGQSTGSERVLRGGSWGNNARYCRAADRGGGTPDNRDGSFGFRLVRLPGQ